VGVLSLDHDAAFAEVTRQHLREHGLAERVTVVDAPLVAHTIRGETWRWYDVSKLPPSAPIDLVLVDGPPVKTQPLARYPALPLLVERLADKAVIILDDAARPSERAVVERWLAEYPGQLTHAYFDILKGMSVLVWRRRAG
jgi:predicted O-methyltransferase YrrM